MGTSIPQLARVWAAMVVNRHIITQPCRPKPDILTAPAGAHSPCKPGLSFSTWYSFSFVRFGLEPFGWMSIKTLVGKVVTNVRTCRSMGLMPNQIGNVFALTVKQIFMARLFLCARHSFPSIILLLFELKYFSLSARSRDLPASIFF
jgi:hypothetical protein